MAPKPKDKPKPSPSPSQPPPPIEDLFSTLNRHIQRSDFEQAVKVADQGPLLVYNSFLFFQLVRFYSLILISQDFFLFFFSFLAVLSVAPGDEDALRCKVVALIKADSIDDALSTIQSAQRPLTDFSYFKVGEHFSFFFFPPI